MSDAQALRDYWSGHGHAGPSHGAERDAIAWGTPGDFDRCVAQVTAHGKMTPEEAKGYCNLRHHDALGEWPAQHAARDRGKMTVTEIGLANQAFQRVKDALFKAADGSGEARVPSGSGVTSGQFTTGSDGPTKVPPKPNPYANGQKKPAAKPKPAAKKPAPKKPPPKAKPDAHQQHVAHLQNEGTAARAQQATKLRGQLKTLDGQLNNLEAEKKKLSTTGISSFGTSSTVSTPSSSSSSTPSSSSTASTSSTSSGSGSSASSSSSSTSAQLAQVNQQIDQVKQQIASVKGQLQQLSQASKSVRNPRDVGGRFRTFNGEIDEAKQALDEGRTSDAMELLGSARALADSDQQRIVVGNLQAAIGRVQHNTVQPQVVKLTPKVVYSRGS